MLLCCAAFARLEQISRPARKYAGVMEPEIRLLVTTLSAKDHSNTGGPVSAAGADLSRLRL